MTTRRAAALLLLALLPVLFFFLADLFPIKEDLLQPDAPSYLGFNAIRTGGYPFFLATLKPLVGDPSGYVPVQLALYALATFVFACVFWRTYDAFLPALLAEIALLGNPLVNAFHFTILTESLFLSVLILFLAAVFSALHRRHLSAIACASLLAGMALAIRPSALALLPALVLLPMLVRTDRWWRRCLVAALPCLAVLALEATYYHAKHGPVRQSLLPIHAMAKGGLLAVPDAQAIIATAPDWRRSLDQALETDLAKVRQLVADAPNLAATCRLIDGYETYIQYRFAADQRDAAQQIGGLRVMLDAGLARIAAAPGELARNVWQHWLCLWTVRGATAADKAEFRAYLERSQPVPYIPEILQEMRPGDSLPFIRVVVALLWLICATFALAGIVTIVSALTGYYNAAFATAGLTGLLLHAGILLTAMTGVSIPRYMFGFWPALVIGCGMLIWFVVLRFVPLRR